MHVGRADVRHALRWRGLRWRRGEAGRREGGAAQTVCGQPAAFEEEGREQRGGLGPAEAACEGVGLMWEVATQRAVTARDDTQPRLISD